MRNIYHFTLKHQKNFLRDTQDLHGKINKNMTFFIEKNIYIYFIGLLATDVGGGFGETTLARLSEDDCYQLVILGQKSVTQQ